MTRRQKRYEQKNFSGCSLASGRNLGRARGSIVAIFKADGTWCTGAVGVCAKLNTPEKWRTTRGRMDLCGGHINETEEDLFSFYLSRSIMDELAAKNTTDKNKV